MSRRRKAPTISDVAQLAGVSTATVSYILSGRRSGASNISEETSQRVLQAVEELGYAPNQIARSLRRQRTDRVCLVLSRLGVPYYDYLASCLQSVAENHGYSSIIVVGGDLAREKEIIEQLRRGLADGVIFMNPQYLEGKDVERLVKFGLAAVVIGNFIQGSGFDIVRTTENEGSYEAVEYLIQKGHRRIAFLGSLSERLSHYQRYLSYVKAMEDQGLPIADELIHSDAGFSREKAYHAACELLRLKEPPTALFAASDVAAVSAIWAARDAGLRVPDDLAVIGAGNIPEGEITRPTLTTVGFGSLDFSDITDLLFSRLEGRAPAEGRIHVRKWSLILRGSA